MSVIKTTPTFRIHRIDGYISNIFLIEYPAAILLFDGGVASDIGCVAPYFREVLKRPVTDIKLIAVSHIHMDHSACAMALRKKHAIPIAAHPFTDRWYAGLSGYIQYRLDCLMTIFVGQRYKKGIQKVTFSRFLIPDYRVQDDDPLPFFDDWRCIYIPGHTCHDIAFYHPEYKLLYAGDLMVNVNGKINLPVPIPFKNSMQKTYERLETMDIETLLLAHGNLIETNTTSDTFRQLIGELKQPPSAIAKRTKYLSLYSPEVWRSGLKCRF